MSEHKTKQGLQNRDVNATSRASLAVKLRAQKVKWEDIAKACGYTNPGTAHKAVMRELERTISEDVAELRREELDSLERLELECWKRLSDKEYSKSMLFAVDRIVAIKERRARLMGLDIPTNNNLAIGQAIIREVPQNYLGVVEAPKP
jgi:hypothetical protein